MSVFKMSVYKITMNKMPIYRKVCEDEMFVYEMSVDKMFV